jgi:hypothetical protein
MDLYGMQASDDTSWQLNISHLPWGLNFNWNRPMMNPRVSIFSERDNFLRNGLPGVGQAAACDHEHCYLWTMVNLTALTHYTLIRREMLVIDKIKEWMTCRNLKLSWWRQRTRWIRQENVLNELLCRCCYISDEWSCSSCTTLGHRHLMLMGKLFIVVRMGISSGEQSLSAAGRIWSRSFPHALSHHWWTQSSFSKWPGKGQKTIKGTAHNSMGNLNEYFGGCQCLFLLCYQLPAQDGIILNLDKRQLRSDSGVR